jgi:hypothetical protein
LEGGINDAGYSISANVRASDWLQRRALQGCSFAAVRSLFGSQNRKLCDQKQL